MAGPGCPLFAPDPRPGRPEAMDPGEAQCTPRPPLVEEVPQAPARRKPPIWTTITTVLAVLACAGAFAGIVVDSSRSTNATHPPPPAAPGPTANATGTSGTSWIQFSGHMQIDALNNEVEAVQSAGGASDLSGMRKACTALGTDVKARLATGPIPPPTVQKPWAAALRDFSAAARDCVNGVDQHDRSLIRASAAEIQDGVTELDRMSAALDAL